MSGQVVAGVYVGERPRVTDAVTRWASILLAALLAAGVPWLEIPTALSIGLAQAWGESRGNPQALNEAGSGARGLWQILSSDYVAQLGGDWSPESQAKVYARELYRQRQRSGSWWTAGLVWAAGPGAARASIEAKRPTKDYMNDQIPYLSALWLVGVPLYGAWVRAWLQTAHRQPNPSRVERWSGVYRWGGASWRVSRRWVPWVVGGAVAAGAGALAWWRA
jgi:hypothetical protein